MSVTQPLDYFLPMIRFNTNMMRFRQNVKWYLYTSSVGVYSPSELMKEEDVWKTFPSDNDRLLLKRIGELQADIKSNTIGIKFQLSDLPCIWKLG